MWTPLRILTHTRVLVRGQSMAPSYPDGRRVWAGRFSYLGRHPARGEVVIVRSPEAPRRWELKRIVGLPHEELAWGGQGLRVNGAAIEEPYARIRPLPPGDDLVHTLRLGPREYFVAGDNRLYSRDSRHYGPVPRRAILARVSRPLPLKLA